MEEPIRILCVFSRLDRGGAESMCMNLYRHIDRDKVQFDFVKHTSDKGDFEDEILQLGGRIFTAPRYTMLNHFSYMTWWKKHFTNHIEHKIIHGHYFTISAVYFYVAKKYGRITIGHSHIAGQRFKIKSIISRLYELWVPKTADYCLACSEAAGKWLFGKRDFIVLKNAIDTDDFIFNNNTRNQIRNSLELNNSFVLGHVGRFFEQKNHSFLIDVFSEVHKKRSDSLLLLIGDGPLHKPIKEKVEKMRLSDSVLFLGVRKNVNELMQAMDVFVFPSLYEGLGIVSIEAQTNGLKCFLSDSITREVDVSGRCEFLPINNACVWANKILNENLAREETIENVIEAGYDIKKTSAWLQDFYTGLFEKRYVDTNV